MYLPDKFHSEFETSHENFNTEFAFDMGGKFIKVVRLARTGRIFTVTTKCADGTAFEEAHEVFEADGPATVTTTNTGVYITSYRSMLSDRLRLRRTRFF